MAIDESIFTPLKNKRAFDEVSSRIKSFIFDGTLKPGDKLPSEAELAKQFAVGRQTIREALRILELSGFIAVKKGYGGGPIVVDRITSKISGLLIDAFQLEKITDDEFWIARLTIEKAIINIVIDNLTDEDLKELQKNVKQAKSLIAQKKVATKLNFEFHSKLAKISKNGVFIILEEALNTIHRKLISSKPVRFETSRVAVFEHEKILKTLIKRDREKVIRQLESYFKAVRKTYKN